MSTIHLIPALTDRESEQLQHETPAYNAKPRSTQPRSSDQEMTQAWSIGVTSAVRTLRQARQEECPPEVYIG